MKIRFIDIMKFRYWNIDEILVFDYLIKGVVYFFIFNVNEY